MKNSMVVLATLGLAFSVNAATLVPMKGVSVYFINGQEAEERIGKNELDQGENQVVVRMDKKLGKGSSSNVYTSAPYVLTVNVTGEEVKINHPVARSEQEAKVAFRGDTPQWRVTQDGYALAYEQEKLKGKDGFMPYMQMDELIAAHNAERGISFTSGEMVVAKSAAPVATAAVATTAVATSVAATTGASASKASASAASKEVVASQASDNVGQLQAWYLKASKQERKEFRKWMIDQE
ncbi:DUF2057 family protein [Vibrio methylphosphonaticus]|uniref:DUF2057 family protein n=1 Tax=Vibrio methylphosphonaticus TaxID=2946866 RepID=UPI00202A3FB4|nr:DUF2057 family protein [Vibrio methylphosphonaticus]MCL9774386.1 DUF2057 domain-containing protein [Vibrio methylphosphonaticus]